MNLLQLGTLSTDPYGASDGDGAMLDGPVLGARSVFRNSAHTGHRVARCRMLIRCEVDRGGVLVMWVLDHGGHVR